MPDLLFALILAGTATRLAWLGYWSKYPAFLAFLVLQAIAACAWIGAVKSTTPLASPRGFLALSSHYDKLAERYGWAPAEALSVILAVVAAAEVSVVADRAGVRMGLPVVAAIVFSLWTGARLIPAHGAYGVFLAIREATWLWIAIAMAGILVWDWLKQVALERHIVLFAILMVAHAFIAPMLRWGFAPEWFTAQLIYRGIAVGCCIFWWKEQKCSATNTSVCW